MNETELFLSEDEALVIQERHLTDATFEASTFDVADKAHIELTGQRVYPAPVCRYVAAVLFDHLAVDFGDQLNESLDDFHVARNGDVSYKTTAVQKMRTVLKLVDGDADTPAVYRHHSADAKYRILIKNDVLNHQTSPSKRCGYRVRSAGQGRGSCRERSVRSNRIRARRD